MSNLGDRQQIADTLSTVDGVTGYPSKPNGMGKGSAWPSWINSARYSMGSYLDTWHVWLVLPTGDELSSAQAGDRLMVPVWEALETIAEVSLCEPLGLMETEGSKAIPVLRYTITTTRGEC